MLLISGAPLSDREASIDGFWLDHPDRYIPSANICNAFAETQMKVLSEEGLTPYYVALLDPAGNGHAAVGIDESDGTYLFDNEHQERAIPLDEYIQEGYAVLAREINGRWYSVSVK